MNSTRLKRVPVYFRRRSDSSKLRPPLQSCFVEREPMRLPVKPYPLSFESRIPSQSAKCIAVKPREAGDAN
jgi:hypothetical protein